MFDMGFVEILVIGIVALVVIGPERLPAVAKKAGYYVGRIQRFITNVRSDVEREFRTDELQRMLTEQQNELQTLKNKVNESVSDASNDLDLESIDQSIKESVKVDTDETAPPPEKIKKTQEKQETESP